MQDMMNYDDEKKGKLKNEKKQSFVREVLVA